MTAMSISQDTEATDSDRADAEEEEEDDALSKSTGIYLFILFIYSFLPQA